MEREGGGLDPAHHVGHKQQESPWLPHVKPLIRLRRVVLRGRKETREITSVLKSKLLGLDQLPGSHIGQFPHVLRLHR